MNTLIKTNSISIAIKNKIILKDISISIHEKDFITIIGPNGAGKSMLLKCLIGLHTPSNGSIQRSNNLKIGYMPQKFLPDQSMPITVKSFLTLRKKAHLSEQQHVIKETHIEKLLDKSLYTLSGGELQGVLLARALLDSPNLLILDEPAQNLDISSQLAFYKLLQSIYIARDISILMVSHDLHMVMSSTKHVICLFHHICCSGEPHEVTKDPEFIAMFGHDMANMIAVYQHSHDHEHEEDYHV